MTGSFVASMTSRIWVDWETESAERPRLQRSPCSSLQHRLTIEPRSRDHRSLRPWDRDLEAAQMSPWAGVWVTTNHTQISQSLQTSQHVKIVCSMHAGLRCSNRPETRSTHTERGASWENNTDKKNYWTLALSSTEARLSQPPSAGLDTGWPHHSPEVSPGPRGQVWCVLSPLLTVVISCRSDSLLQCTGLQHRGAPAAPARLQLHQSTAGTSWGRARCRRRSCCKLLPAVTVLQSQLLHADPDTATSNTRDPAP